MHALRKIHHGLVPGGTLLDVHPVPPSARAERAGEILGEFEDAEFFDLVRRTEEELDRAALFELDDELRFDWLERYDSADELLQVAEDWEGCRVPPSVSERIRAAEPPIDIWERVVLRRFRAL